MRAADTLGSVRQAARGGLQRLDLEKESDTFNEEAAVTLDSIPATKKDFKILYNKSETEGYKIPKYIIK